MNTNLSNALDITNILVAQAQAAAGEEGEYRLTRDDDLDLAFTGWEVAEGRCGDREFERDWTRWTIITLYVTAGGRFIVGIERHSKWQGATSRYDATVHETFDDVLNHLKGDNDGRVGTASKAMIENAVASLDCLGRADVERVE